MLTVMPLGGLCNRMRVVDSAIQFAEDSGTHFNLIWEIDASLCTPLETLFEPLPRIHKLIQLSSLNRRGILIGQLYQRFLLNPFLECTISNEDVVQLRNQLPTTPPFVGKSRVLVRTWERFYQSPSRAPFRDFSPVRAVREQVDALRLDSRATVGVHIRRTDHAISRARSTTDRFIHAMRTELEREPNTDFFVCTDAPEEVTHLQQLFGKRILTRAKRSLDRAKPEAIEDAIVDLWGLSRCRRVLGSYGSSFSLAAAQLGGVDCEMVGADS